MLGLSDEHINNITAYKKQSGKFKDIKDFQNVLNDDALFSKIKDNVVVTDTIKTISSVNIPSSEKININTASLEQLESLPKVGPVTAKNIVDYRESNGPFRSIEDIQNVPRIGPKTFENLRPYITTGNDEEPVYKKSSDSDTSSPDKININTASETKLATVPGIGPKTARSIVEYREQHGPFKSVDELENVPRIGKKTIEKVKPYLTVE